MRAMNSTSNSAVTVSMNSVNRITSARRLSRAEFGQSQREVGLRMVIVEPRRGAQELGEVGNATARLLILAQHLVKPIDPDEVAALQRNPGEQQTGIDRVVESRQSVHRFDHQITGVEGEYDVMVAFGAKLFAHELAVTRGALPVDEAAVEPGRVVAQCVELGAFALVGLHLAAEQRLARRTRGWRCARPRTFGTTSTVV